MKTRIKSSYCTNCGQALTPSANYCPDCGQENDSKRQSFGRVMYDLIQGFLSIDSRLAHSLPALLFRPGFLTKEYLIGRRQNYLDPVRMFITIVVIYFILSSFGTDSNQKEENTLSDVIENAKGQEGDTIIFNEGPFKIKVDGNKSTGSESDPVVIDPEDLELDTPHYIEIRKMVKKGVTDTEAILDSLNIENTIWNRFYYGEVIKFASTDFEEFKSFLLSKLPWIIFFLMPVFALLLKLIYIRNNLLYIDHLIFAFHLHSLLFMIGTIYLIYSMIISYDISMWFVFAVLIYILFAFRNFYMQSWRKTIFKIFTMIFLYGFSTLFFFLISLLVVFILF